jgi:hypothetical protein
MSLYSSDNRKVQLRGELKYAERRIDTARAQIDGLNVAFDRRLDDNTLTPQCQEALLGSMAAIRALRDGWKDHLHLLQNEARGLGMKIQ